tara:strand:+ start:64547 stop:65167 length:621 start_codon:yes stop_codon:yes gene_type:complete
MKKYIVLILLTSFGFLAHKYWKSTPQYSAKRVLDSIENNDIYLFEKHFDVERVADNMSNEIVALMTKENIDNTDDDDWGLIGKEFASGLMELMKPILSKQISNEIRKSVSKKETNSLTSDSLSFALFETSDLSLINKDKISVTIGLLFDSENIKFKKEGSTTTLEVSIDPPSENDLIKIVLNKYENYWKVTEINNLISFISENEDF